MVHAHQPQTHAQNAQETFKSKVIIDLRKSMKRQLSKFIVKMESHGYRLDKPLPSPSPPLTPPQPLNPLPSPSTIDPDPILTDKTHVGGEEYGS